MAMKNIYVEYFEIIEKYFNPMKAIQKKKRLNYIELASEIKKNELLVDLFSDSIEDLNDEIYNFWSLNAKSVVEHIKKMNNLKCIFSGEISPYNLEKFVKRTALYVDTIIIPDPIYNILTAKKAYKKDIFISLLIKNIFNIWSMKNLILKKDITDILFIVPININLINKKNQDILFQNAEFEFIKYCYHLTKKRFKNINEILYFFKTYNEITEIYNIINSSYFPYEYREFPQFQNFIEGFKVGSRYVFLEKMTYGEIFSNYLYSQILRVQEHKYICKLLNGEPIYGCESPWFFFNAYNRNIGMDNAIANALQQNTFDWLGNVPIEAISILREKNKLDYMRSIFRKGIIDLKVKNDDRLIETTKQLEINLNAAFKKQKSEEEALKNEINKIIKIRLPLKVIVNILGFVPYLSGAISLFSGVKDIMELLKEKAKKERELNNENFINILIKAKGEN